MSELLYAGYKHGEMIKRIVQSQHKPWMNDSDKQEFDEILLSYHGKEIDDAIEVGISKGVFC